MLMFNNLIDGEWLSDGARAPNVNPSRAAAFTAAITSGCACPRMSGPQELTKST